MLLGVLFARDRAKSFPVFTSWILVGAVRDVVLYLVHRYALHAYFNTFWAFGSIDVCLQLGVFFEMAFKVFCPLGYWASDVKRGFQLVLAGSFLVALLLTWTAHPYSRGTIAIVVHKMDFFSSALLSELFLGTLILSSWAGLPWKTHVARISQGLGTFAAIGLITQGAHTQPSSSNLTVYFFWSHVEIFFYLCCMSYWIVTLWREAEAPRELPDKIREELAHLNRLLTFGGGGSTRQ
ncbi:hypothetical protein SAMN05421819_2614 [Bryocella elongata]|uniref:Uncharacterized protein n=1 Tax=Bryocella elongata TaxID=863522 RepID=A0A1H5ZE99_9BACT|nr:hypothetical protein [Bryocella elongata]SEG34799.1 hypothetical protein SAMN05421819_2614 [Bryocella elongata]